MLPKEQRLRKAADFRKVRNRGKQWRSPSFLAFVAPAGQPSARVGVIVSAKIGKAVVRKRASRILRSGYAAAASSVGTKDIVLIARPMIKGRTAEQISQELQRMTRFLR